MFTDIHTACMLREPTWRCPILDRLDLTDVTVVANDTGGAITQLPVAAGSELLASLVVDFARIRAST